MPGCLFRAPFFLLLFEILMISNAYAQAAAAPGGGDIFSTMLPMLILLGVFWLLLIRPQMKKAKEHRSFVDALKVGDEVSAIGIVGKISKLDENYVNLEVAPGTVILIERGAVNKPLPIGTINKARG
jgi:preprotein translocase subunit YajC